MSREIQRWMFRFSGFIMLGKGIYSERKYIFKLHVSIYLNIGGIYVSIADSLSIAFFCVSVVFVLLGGLYVLMNLFTDGIRFIETKDK